LKCVPQSLINWSATLAMSMTCVEPVEEARSGVIEVVLSPGGDCSIALLALLESFEAVWSLWPSSEILASSATFEIFSVDFSALTVLNESCNASICVVRTCLCLTKKTSKRDLEIKIRRVP
jgi:hypothetical protein